VQNAPECQIAYELVPLLKHFRDYDDPTSASEVGLFLVESPVQGIFTGNTYRETAYEKSHAKKPLSQVTSKCLAETR
jgi:hypothetical protein